MGILSIHEFNTNISGTLARVEKGEDVILTRRGKRIARLTRDGLDTDDEAQRKADLDWWFSLMDRAPAVGGPASADERAGLVVRF
jgi:Antitoxin Phd_YefM, type II toxin-antitoxin system